MLHETQLWHIFFFLYQKVLFYIVLTMRYTVLKNICGKDFLDTFFGVEIKTPSKLGFILTPRYNYLVRVWTVLKITSICM